MSQNHFILSFSLKSAADANGYGLFDMAGNVWQRTKDW
jgi:formylglycine-generating enzyme required for sulfatase activity